MGVEDTIDRSLGHCSVSSLSPTSGILTQNLGLSTISPSPTRGILTQNPSLSAISLSPTRVTFIQKAVNEFVNVVLLDHHTLLIDRFITIRYSKTHIIDEYS